MTSLTRTFASAALVAAFTGLTSTAMANDFQQNFDNRFYADVGISTLGLSAQIGMDVTDDFSLRVQGNYAELNASNVDIASLTAEGELSSTSVGLIGDMFFGGTNFYFSAGAYLNDTTVKASAPVDVDVTINGVNYTAADIGNVSAQAEYSSVAPYIGMGYRKALNNRMRIGVDFGVLYIGEPDFTLDADINDPTLEAAIRSDLDQELANFVADYEDDLSNFEFAPKLRLSVGIAF